MLATQHYTEILEAQQQKAAAVEEHMLIKSNSGKQSASMGVMSLRRKCTNSSCS